MEIVYHICCGIDVHAKFLVACLLAEGKEEARRFSTMTCDLVKLRKWLTDNRCGYVAIESTGVYWKPVFNILERDLKVILVNPEHARALRGRKTDRLDSIRLAQLLSVGLLEGSFIPPAHIRRLRELTRYRESLVRTHTAAVNRIQKVSESANIKLAQVASDVMGTSGRRMLAALAAGVTDPASMAQLALGKLKHKQAELQQALDGALDSSHRFVLGELLGRIREMEAAQEKVNSQINRAICDPDHPELLKAWELIQTIPGVGHIVAEVVIAEIGVNLRYHFPTPDHLASWAGIICPGNKASGGKRFSGRTRRGNRYFRTILVQAAWAATHTKQTYLSAMYRRLVRRMGKKKALVAAAHALAVMIYHMVDRSEPYTELGADYFERTQPEKQLRYHVKRLQTLGFKVTLEKLADAV